MSHRTVNAYFISSDIIIIIIIPSSHGLLRRLLRYRRLRARARVDRRGGRGGRPRHFELRELICRVQSSGTLSRPINFTARPLLIGPAARPLLCAPTPPLADDDGDDPSGKIHYAQDFIVERLIRARSRFYFARARTRASRTRSFEATRRRARPRVRRTKRDGKWYRDPRDVRAETFCTVVPTTSGPGRRSRRTRPKNSADGEAETGCLPNTFRSPFGRVTVGDCVTRGVWTSQLAPVTISAGVVGKHASARSSVNKGLGNLITSLPCEKGCVFFISLSFFFFSVRIVHAFDTL